MMTRMKDREGRYDFAIAGRLIKHYLGANPGTGKIELSYPNAVPKDLGQAMAGLFIQEHGVDIVIADQPFWAVSLVGVKGDK